MGRVIVDSRVSKKSSITTVTLIKITNKIEEILEQKEPKPRAKWQTKVGWNGEQYHVFLREYDGKTIIKQITPARDRAKYGVKTHYTAESTKKDKKRGVKK